MGSQHGHLHGFDGACAALPSLRPDRHRRPSVTGGRMTWDAIVLGAGFFGCRIALHLASRGLARVLLVDAAPAIMSRASTWNQARIHGGYHYPRAYLTALASRRSYDRFVADHRDAIAGATRALYAIARGSRVSPGQFERLCVSIGAPLATPPADKSDLFDADLIEAVYEVEEAVFDASLIARRMHRELEAGGVVTKLGAPARLADAVPGRCVVAVGDVLHAAARVYNCTYAALDDVGVGLRAMLRREWAEMALIEPPAALEGWGVTVMDGPFFSAMPFPHLGCHTLSHVRYTPVRAWTGGEGRQAAPAEGATAAHGANAAAMLRDATRYLPKLREARLRGTVRSVKTVLDASERDDGRPMLVEQMEGAPQVVSILGSKLDTVYDVLEEIDDLLDGAGQERRRQLA